jgi:hypothetical protein
MVVEVTYGSSGNIWARLLSNWFGVQVPGRSPLGTGSFVRMVLFLLCSAQARFEQPPLPLSPSGTFGEAPPPNPSPWRGTMSDLGEEEQETGVSGRMLLFFYCSTLSLWRRLFLRNNRGTKTSRCPFIYKYQAREIVSRNNPKTNMNQGNLGVRDYVPSPPKNWGQANGEDTSTLTTRVVDVAVFGDYPSGTMSCRQTCRPKGCFPEGHRDYVANGGLLTPRLVAACPQGGASRKLPRRTHATGVVGKKKRIFLPKKLILIE